MFGGDIFGGQSFGGVPKGTPAAAPVQASPLPTMHYLVAFNNKAFDDLTAITATASPPTLGGVNVWTDITQYVLSHEINRGRQHELSRFESGTLTLELNDNTDVFNSWNVNGPYYGKLTLGLPVQVRATYAGITYTMYTGYIDAWPTVWSDPVSAWKKVTASDIFRLFSLQNLTQKGYSAAIIGDIVGGGAYYRLGDVGTNVATAYGPSGALTPSLYGTYQGGTQGVTGALATDTNLAWDAGNYLGKVAIPSSAIPTGSGAMSFECWVNLHGQPNADNLDRLVNAFTAAITPAIFNVTLNKGSGNSCGFQMQIADAVNTQSFSVPLTALPIDGNWHHIVWTRDGTGNNFAIYIDSVAQTLTTVFNTGIVNVPVADPGASLASSSISGNRLNGALDEVVFYQGQLTSVRVTAHYNASLYVAEPPGSRASDVLNGLSWPVNNQFISVLTSTDAPTIQKSTTSLVTTKVLSHLQQVEQSSDGALFVRSDGRVAFIDREKILGTGLYNASQMTLGDNPSANEVPFQVSPDLAFDDIDIRNEVTVQNVGGVLQTAGDSTSQTNYGRRTFNVSNNLGSADSDAANLANWYLTRYKNPVERMRKVTIRPLDNPTLIYPLILNRELMDRITIIRHGLPGAGSAFRIDSNIEHITDRMSPTSWTVEYGLANALPAVGLWNDTTYGRWSDSTPLNASITSGAASMVVTIAANTPAWTTTDVPLQVKVDAEIMTVSAIGALGGGTQTLTISARGVNSTTAVAHSSGALVTPYPACVYGF